MLITNLFKKCKIYICAIFLLKNSPKSSFFNPKIRENSSKNNPQKLKKRLNEALFYLFLTKMKRISHPLIAHFRSNFCSSYPRNKDITSNFSSLSVWSQGHKTSILFTRNWVVDIAPKFTIALILKTVQ